MPPQSGGSFLGIEFSRKGKKHFEQELGFIGAAVRIRGAVAGGRQRWCGNLTPLPHAVSLAFKNKVAFSLSNFFFF